MIQLRRGPNEYAVEVSFDELEEVTTVDGWQLDDSTRVEAAATVIARAKMPPPPPVPLTRRERDGVSRLRWVLDELGIGCFGDEVVKRMGWGK